MNRKRGSFLLILLFFTIGISAQNQFDWKKINQQAIDHYVKGEYEIAEGKASEALIIAEKVFGGKHDNYRVSLNNYGRILHLRKKFKEADKIYTALLGSLTDNDKQGEEYLTILNNAGELQMKIGKNREAEDKFSEIIRLCNRTDNSESNICFAALVNIGNLKKRAGNLNRAAGYLEKALKTGKKVFGEESWKLKEVMRSLGVIYFELKQFIKADEIIKYRAELNRKTATSNFVEYNNSGAIYFYKGLNRAAERKFMAAVETAPEGELVTVLINLGTLYYSVNRYRRAIKVLKKADEIISKESGSDTSFNKGLIFYKLGQVYERQHRYLKASDYLKKAYEIFRGDGREEVNSVDVSKTLYRLGQMYISRRLPGRAEDYFNESRRAGREHGMDRNPYIFGCINYLRRIYEIRKEKKSVLKMFDEEITLSGTGKVRNVEHMIAVLMEKASYLRSVNMTDEALQALKKAEEASQQLNIADHPVTLHSLTELMAEILMDMKQYKESEKYYRARLKQITESKGEENPDKGSILVALAELKYKMREKEEALKLCRESLTFNIRYIKPGSIYMKQFLQQMSELFKKCGDKVTAGKLKKEAAMIKLPFSEDERGYEEKMKRWDSDRK